MKPEVLHEEFLAVKPKMNSFLVNNSEHKKAKDGNKMLLQQQVIN